MANICPTYLKGLCWEIAPCPCHIYWMSSALLACRFAVSFLQQLWCLSCMQQKAEMEQEGDQGGMWAWTASSCGPPLWDRVSCRKVWFNVFNPKFGSKQLSGILHKAAWQGILHAMALQLLKGDQTCSRTTLVALAPSDAIAPSPLPPAPSCSHKSRAGFSRQTGSW